MSKSLKTPSCFNPWIPEVAIPQFQSTSTQSETNISNMEVISKTRSKFEHSRSGYRKIEFKTGIYLENTFFFTNAGSIRSDIPSNENLTIGLNRCHQDTERKISTLQNPLCLTDFPPFQSFENQGRSTYNAFIPTVSKVEKVKDIVDITNSFVNKFNSNVTICEKSHAVKSVPINDAVYDLIRQQRLSWWSEDEKLPCFTVQSTSICYYKSVQRDIYKASSEFRISSNYESRRKCRAQQLEHQKSEMALKDGGPQEFERNKQVFIRPKNEKSISWKTKFSDESEFEDSESSLEGSFRRNSSDSSDASDCESFTCLTTLYSKSRAPPTSSRIFDDSVPESESEFPKTCTEQFRPSDLAKSGDKCFLEDFGFIAVTLQALQCLCLYSENVEL